MMDSEFIYSKLIAAGFVQDKHRSRLFLYNKNPVISPGFYCEIQKKSKSIRISGAIGLYFPGFETEWSAALDKKERSLDHTLPMLMKIDNFVPLLNKDFFKYSDDILAIQRNIADVHSLCRNFPKTLNQFRVAIKEDSISGISIREYLHIASYNDNDNLYFRKSALFLRWIITNYPLYADGIYDDLSNYQRARLSEFGLR